MKLYNPKEFNVLIDYKNEMEDSDIKKALESLLSNYNIMYLRFREYLRKKEDTKGLYANIENLQRENEKLKAKVEKQERLIKLKDKLIEQLSENSDNDKE